MIWILTIAGAIAGAIVGGVVAELPGVFTGGILGYLVAISTLHNKRLDQLKEKLSNLESRQKITLPIPAKTALPNCSNLTQTVQKNVSSNRKSINTTTRAQYKNVHVHQDTRDDRSEKNGGAYTH